MKKILFVIPSLNVGGTNSSLSNFYLNIRDQYDISIYSLSYKRESIYSFDDRVLPSSRLLTMIGSSLNNTKGIEKLFSYIFKTINKLLSFINVDFRSFVYSFFVKRLEKAYNFDIVVGFQEGTATKFASLFKCKKIAWVHCDYRYYIKNRKRETAIYEKFQRIICVSKYTSNSFSSVYPNLQNKVDYIYNIIDTTEVLQKSDLEIDDSRFIKAPLTFISAGRLMPIKNFDKIPTIAKVLKNAGCKFKWYLLGPSSDFKYTDDIIHGIKTQGVDDCVVWLGNKENPYPYMKNSDVYLCLSESEACPMVFCESFTLGVPVVTTSFGSSFEFIESGKNGIQSDLDRYSDTLMNLCFDGKKILSMKEYLRNYKSFNEASIESIHQLLN